MKVESTSFSSAVNRISKTLITQFPEIGVTSQKASKVIDSEEGLNPEITLSNIGKVASEVSSHGFSNVVIDSLSRSKLSKFDHDDAVLEIVESIKSTLKAGHILVDHQLDSNQKSKSAALINTLLSAVFTGKTEVEISNLILKKGARLEINREPYGNGFFTVRKITISYEVEYGTIKASAEFSGCSTSSQMNVLIEAPEGYVSEISENAKELKTALHKKKVNANVSCRQG